MNDLQSIFDGPFTGAKWKMLEKWLRSQQVFGGRGVGVSRSSSGTILSAPKGRSYQSGSLINFQVHSVRYDSGTQKYYAKVTPGWVAMMDPAGGDPPPDCFNYIMPRIETGSGKQPHNEVPDQDIEWSPGQMLAVHVQTDDSDGVKDDEGTPLVNIVATAESQDSVHYQPPNPDEVEGTDGSYYYRLATFEIDPQDDGKITVYQYQPGGTIVHRPNLWKGANMGAGGDVFKRRDDALNQYEFKGVEGFYGITDLSADNDVLLNFSAENVGDTSEACPVYVNPNLDEDDELLPEKAQFRKIKQRGTSPQVKVKCEEVDGVLPDEITIRGNDYDLAGVPLIGKQITIVDGLVTSLLDDGGGRGNFDIIFRKALVQIGDYGNDDYRLNMVDSQESSRPTIYVRDGIVYRNSADIPNDAPASSGSFNLYVDFDADGSSQMEPLWDPA